VTLSLRRLFLAVALLVGASGAWAMPASSAPPTVEPVLSRVPAGTLGFVMIHEAGSFGGKIDKFLDDLGLGQMLSQPDPADPDKTVRIPVLDMVRGALQLGSGFNPKGGIAAVMLDPNEFGIDVLKMINPEGNGPPQETKLPFVIYVPGKSIEETLGAYQPEKAGKYMKVMLPVGPMLAAQQGGYILLSPMDKALDKVLATKRKAMADLPEEQVVMLARADLAYYINFELAGPLFQKLIGLLEQQMQMGPAPMPGPMAPLMGMYFKFYKDMIGQLDDVSVAGRFVDTGIVFEEMVSFKPGTTFGKALAGTRPMGKAVLNALPDLPYVLAMGSVGDDNPQAGKIGMDFINDLLQVDPLAGVPEAEKARMRKLVAGFNEQITGFQMVGGGAPAGNGLFGVSFVIQCKDAAKVKALLAEKAQLIQGLIRHFGGEDENVQKLQVRYVKGVESVGSVSVDAISIEHPDLDTMEEDERIEMKKVLGENKIRFLVAAPSNKAVVVTFGGSRAFLAEALKVADGSGKIGTDAATAQAMKHMPKNPTFVLLLNGANLYELIVAGMKVMEPGADLPPFKVTCKTPIAMVGGLKGKSMHVAAYIPTDLVKEVVGIFMMFAGGMGPGSKAGPDDF